MREKAPERLFRDDGGAAIERVARLEDENRQLRAEIARLKRPGRDAPTVRTRLRPSETVLLAVMLVTGLAGIFVFVGTVARVRDRDAAYPPAAPTLRPRIVSADPPPRVPPVDEVGPTYASPPGTIIGASPLPSSGCTPPFWYDARGVKHYKERCLAR